MTEPFTPTRVTRFLLLCALAIAGVFGLFQLLTHARARQAIPTDSPHSQFMRPQPDALSRALPVQS